MLSNLIALNFLLLSTDCVGGHHPGGGAWLGIIVRGIDKYLKEGYTYRAYFEIGENKFPADDEKQIKVI